MNVHQLTDRFERNSKQPTLTDDILRLPTYWSHAHAARHEPSIDSAARWNLLQQFGGFSIAYSVAFQPHLDYCGDEAGVIAFRKRAGVAFALGDPLCGADQKPALVQRFLREQRKPTFVQVSRETAELLQGHGYWINEMGIDTSLELATYDFKGKDKEWLRYADNWISRRDYSIREFSLADEEQQVVQVSEAWRSTRQIKRKEVRFLNRPIVLMDEPGVRRFGLFRGDGILEAFVSFDPLFHHGETIGYVTCTKRRLPEASQYAESAIMKRAIEQLQRDGVRTLRLGLSPLAQIEDHEFRANRWLSWWTRYYFRAGWINRNFYHLMGHAQYKKRFRGAEEKLYFASPVRFNGYRLLTLASICGVF